MDSANLPVELPIDARPRSLSARTSQEPRRTGMTKIAHPVWICAQQRQVWERKVSKEDMLQQADARLQREATSGRRVATIMDKMSKTVADAQR